MYILSEKNWKKIALVDMLTEQSKLFSLILEKTIKKYKKLWRKILFIVNRKGYTSSSICLDCGYVPKCDFCDVPIAKYKSDAKFIYMCPICRRIYEDIIPCKKCWSYNVKDYGIWTYKFQELLKQTFNIDSFVIENTDINSLVKISKINNILPNQQFVISTSILSSSSSFFNPDLIVFFNADTWLLLPDFNVAEKHFLMMWEFIHNYDCKNYILQTFNTNHYVYKYLLNLDLYWFWKEELKYRKQFSYPPYFQLAILMYKSEIEDKLYRKISKLESELKYLIGLEQVDIEIFPTPQLIYKKFWKYHYNIILKWKDVKSFLDKASKLLKLQQKWFQIDYLPMNII